MVSTGGVGIGSPTRAGTRGLVRERGAARGLSAAAGDDGLECLSVPLSASIMNRI